MDPMMPTQVCKMDNVYGYRLSLVELYIIIMYMCILYYYYYYCYYEYVFINALAQSTLNHYLHNDESTSFNKTSIYMFLISRYKKVLNICTIVLNNFISLIYINVHFYFLWKQISINYYIANDLSTFICFYVIIPALPYIQGSTLKYIYYPMYLYIRVRGHRCVSNYIYVHVHPIHNYTNEY